MNATAPPNDGPAATPATDGLLPALVELSANDNLSVGKDGFNPHFNYGYMTEAALFTAARAALAEVGLSGTISFVDGAHEHITTAHRDDNGNTYERPAVMATVTAELSLRDRNGLTVQCRAFGQGVDSADKAYAKAMTMASKYVMQKALLIAVESDDTDSGNSGNVSRSSGSAGGAASEKQLGFLCSLVKKLHLAESSDPVDVEFTAWRLGRMQGDNADTFAKLTKATASALIEKLKAVEDNPRAKDVILERLVAWEVENGLGAAPDAGTQAAADDNDSDEC